MTTLYLTAAETPLFQALPEAIRKEYSVENEVLTFDDHDARRRARLGLMELKDKKLLALQEKAKTLKTGEELQALVQSADLSSIDDQDLFELFFAIGPDGVTAMIVPSLRDAKDAKDMESLAALTALRHALLTAMQS